MNEVIESFDKFLKKKGILLKRQKSGEIHHSFLLFILLFGVVCFIVVFLVVFPPHEFLFFENTNTEKSCISDSKCYKKFPYPIGFWIHYDREYGNHVHKRETTTTEKPLTAHVSVDPRQHSPEPTLFLCHCF